MLRKKCSYRNNIETRKKPESKKKIEIKLVKAIEQKQLKAKLTAENANI